MPETENETTEKTPEAEPTEEPQETRTLTQEEINKLIEGARKQEKDKLYDTISSLKDEVKNLTDAQKKERQDKDRAEQEAAEQADKKRQDKLTAEERVAEQLKRLEEKLAREEVKREKLQENLEEERKNTELERYKNEVLNSAGDDILRELVQGTTKEEIDHSVAVARQKYQDYFQAALKLSAGKPGRSVGEQIGAQMPGPADPDPDPMDEEALKGLVPQVDPYQSGAGKVSEDYKKNRDEILSRVAGAYKKSSR